MNASLNIFANATLGTGPARPPRASMIPERSPTKLPARISMQSIIESELARILDANSEPGESVQRTFDRKEAEVRALFDSLSSDECATIHLAIVHGQSTVASFTKITAERRGRLLAFLTNPNRRRPR